MVKGFVEETNIHVHVAGIIFWMILLYLERFWCIKNTHFL